MKDYYIIIGKEQWHKINNNSFKYLGGSGILLGRIKKERLLSVAVRVITDKKDFIGYSHYSISHGYTGG